MSETKTEKREITKIDDTKMIYLIESMEYKTSETTPAKERKKKKL